MKSLRSIPAWITQLFITQRALHKNWIISVTTKFSWLLLLASFICLLWFWNTLPPEVPLWYFQPWGQERLAPVYFLWILPLGLLFWNLVNIYITSTFTHMYLVFTQIMYLVSLIISLLTTVTLIKIVFLVT